MDLLEAIGGSNTVLTRVPLGGAQSRLRAGRRGPASPMGVGGPLGGRRSLVREEQPRAVGRRRTEGAGGGRRVQERERNRRRQQALVAARERGRGTGGGERRVREREDELAAACERGCARMREMV